MPDLFGNAASQLPPWLTNQPTGSQFVDKAFQAKQQAFRNFSDLTDLSMRVQQHEALMPLQIQAQRNQIASQTLDIAGKQLAQDNEVKTKLALTTLASTMASIKDWKSPASITAIEEVVAANPVLGMTQPGQMAIRQAYQQHQIAYELDSKITADKARQKEMTDRETQRQKEISARELAVEKERQTGRLAIAKGRAIPNSVPEATRRNTILEGQMLEAENAGDAELYNALQTEKNNNQKWIDQQSAPKGAAAKAPSFDIATGQLKTPAGDVALTTSNKTLAERVVTQANVAKTIVDELNKDISMTDIGPVGRAKDVASNMIGLAAPGVGSSKAQTVQQNLKNLQGTINAMKTADRRGSIAELRAAADLIPASGFALESAGHARNNLDKLVKNVLIPNARANAAQLGVRAPVWSLLPKEVLAAKQAGDKAIANGLSPTSPEFRSKFLTEVQARNILQYYEDNGRKMPNDIIE